MQTLNVGAGRTDEEYNAAEDQRRADLLAEGRSNANYFFAAAVLAALATGLLPLKVNFLVSIGLVDLLTIYGKGLGERYVDTVHGAALAWVLALIALGFAARNGRRWAFQLGVVIYAIDMAALILTFSVWAFGVHAFFVYKWFEGQKALKDVNERASN
jgi:thiol:disulfide interchange protein